MDLLVRSLPSLLGKVYQRLVQAYLREGRNLLVVPQGSVGHILGVVFYSFLRVTSLLLPLLAVWVLAKIRHDLWEGILLVRKKTAAYLWSLGFLVKT
jgi:hypothetical protein